MASLRMRFNESVCASRTMLSNLLLPWLQEIGAMQRFYPCQASWRHKKIKLTVHAVERKDAQKLERASKQIFWLLFKVISASSVNHAKRQSWESDHFPILATYPAVACAQIENPKGCERSAKLLKVKSWRSNRVLKNSKESIICSCFEAMRCSSAASLGKQFQLAVCQHVWEDLEVQNSIAMPHLKSWKTSGLQKIGRVPNHVSHKWDSWDHLCETLCVHKCVIQVAKAALLWTRLYKHSGSQRSIKSLQSGQSLRCSALHKGKKKAYRDSWHKLGEDANRSTTKLLQEGLKHHELWSLCGLQVSFSHVFRQQFHLHGTNTCSLDYVQVYANQDFMRLQHFRSTWPSWHCGADWRVIKVCASSKLLVAKCKCMRMS